MLKIKPSGLLWLCDAVAAILFAAALALAVSSAAARGMAAAWPYALLLLAAALLRAGVQFGATTMAQRAAALIKRGWRERVYRPVLVSRTGDRHMLGEQVADAVDRLEDVDGYHARFLPIRQVVVLAPLLIAGAAAFGSVIAAAIMLATLIPFGLGMALAGSAAGRAADRQFDALARLSGLFIDRVRALPMILSFGAEDRIVRQMGGATREVADRTLAMLRIAFLSGAVIEFFAAISVALVAVYCGFNLLGLLPFPVPEKLNLGQALFVLALAPEFYLPMRRLAAAYHEKQLGEAAIDRLAGLEGLAEQQQVTAAGASSGFNRPPVLRFDGVVVDYGERRIGPVTLDVPAGQMTAITGPTGVGKSSLLHVLLGLAPLGAGRILMDGEPAVPERFQGAIGWAGQVTALVPGTLAENIRLARPDATYAQVDAAARRAGLGPMIDARAGGLDMIVDHRGSGLSGGERRRIGIARVLLKDAPLWLLDEPTADLDAASAAQIGAILREAGRGRTVLLVTHGTDLAASADHKATLQ